MKKTLVFILGLFIVLGFSGFALAQDDLGETTVVVDVIKETISIDVPESINFGTIAKGYVSDRKDVDIVNTGNIDLMITPEVSQDYTGEIFDYISFRKILTDDPVKIGLFSIDVEKPTTLGDTKTTGFYSFLDLEKYPYPINQSEENHNSSIVFWATAK